MSARRVVSLTLALPPESRLMRAAAGSSWSLEQTLAGLLVERLDALHATYVRAHGGKVGKLQNIVPRPKPARRAATPAGTFLAGLDTAIAAAGGDA